MIPLDPVGVARTPFPGVLDAPRQGEHTRALAEIHVEPRFAPALGRLAPPARLVVVGWAHLADRAHLARPDGTGAFEGRGAHRPNPILFTEVELVERRGDVLVVRGLDFVDGTPVLDLKSAHAEIEGPVPFLREAAEHGAAIVGWERTQDERR